MNTLTKFLLNLVGSTALAVLTCTILFGWKDFTDALGGAKSFAGLMALLAMGGSVIWGIIFLQNQSYEDRLKARIVHLLLGVSLAGILTTVGYIWVDLPNGAGIKVLVCMALCATLAAGSTVLGFVDDK